MGSRAGERISGDVPDGKSSHPNVHLAEGNLRTTIPSPTSRHDRQHPIASATDRVRSGFREEDLEGPEDRPD